MNTNPSAVDALIRSADPVTAQDVQAWRASAAFTALRAGVPAGDDSVRLDVTNPGRGGRVRTLAMVALVALVLGAGGAVAAVLLGEPAPPAVKKDLAEVDAGYPADLRLNPDVTNARSVAANATSTLYYAQLRDGGYCTELVISDVPRGAVCTTASHIGSLPIEVTIPFTIPLTANSPVTIAGRANATGVSSLRILYGDGSSDEITLGDDGFFVFDIPVEHVHSVHSMDFQVIGLAEDGAEVTRVDVPAVGVEPDGPIDDPAPISVDTISEGADLTKVLGVRGKVKAEGATSLEFVYPDGTKVSMPLEKDGSYSFDIPADRQGDLFEAPGTLIARDEDGAEVASAPVAAVAFWRAHDG